MAAQEPLTFADFAVGDEIRLPSMGAGVVTARRGGTLHAMFGPRTSFKFDEEWMAEHGWQIRKRLPSGQWSEALEQPE